MSTITLGDSPLGPMLVDEADAALFRLMDQLGIPVIPIAIPTTKKDEVQFHLADVTALERFLEAVANNLGATVAERHGHPVYEALNKLNPPREWYFAARPVDLSADPALPARFTTFVTLCFPRSHLPAVLVAIGRAVQAASIVVVSTQDYPAGRPFIANC